MDISVIYIILRNICKIPDHKKGWGNAPLKGDTSLAACIERIRLQRNSLTGHSTNGMVEDVEFQNIWAELRNAIVDIEKQLTGGESYQRHVDALLTCSTLLKLKCIKRSSTNCKVSVNLSREI